jgi:hypothetical protein
VRVEVVVLGSEPEVWPSSWQLQVKVNARIALPFTPTAGVCMNQSISQSVSQSVNQFSQPVNQFSKPSYHSLAMDNLNSSCVSRTWQAGLWEAA